MKINNANIPYSDAPLYSRIPEICGLVLDSVPNNIVKKIYLFGSYSRGEATKDSDLDVCIIVNNECDFRNIYVDIAGKLMDCKIMPCDKLVIPEKYFEEKKYPEHINNIIKNEGILLYG